MKFHSTHAILFLVLLSSLLPAQTRKLAPKDLPASAFKLISVKVTGTRHTSEEIVGASGLQIGQTVSDDDFKSASRALGETGAFSNVLYAFQYSTQGTKLEFQLTDNDQLVPARFDNFVWFSDQEVMQKLHQRVPLFDGKLPVAGSLADQVSDALQAVLIEHNVPGRADYLRSAALNGPIEAFEFRVTGPVIHIRNVDFAGAGADQLPALETAAKKLPGQDYLRSKLRAQEDKDFLPVYLARGYLKANFGDAQAKVVQDTSEETLVDVTFPVDPGRQYKVAEIQLSGYKAFPDDKLRGLIRQPVGQPANAVQLGEDIDAIQKLYGTKGYMSASVQPAPQMDEAQSTVKYLLEFHEGDIFKMGDLDIQGLDTRTTARLQDEWKLRGGDPYDSSYPAQFVRQALKQLELMGEWNVTIHESVDQKDKLVDVTLRFDPKSR